MTLRTYLHLHTSACVCVLETEGLLGAVTEKNGAEARRGPLFLLEPYKS